MNISRRFCHWPRRLAWWAHVEKEMIIGKVIFEISWKNDVHNNYGTDYRHKLLWTEARITSNLLHGFIVSYLSICAWFPVEMIYDFLYFGVFFQCFYLEKMWPEKKMLRFLIKSSFLWISHQNHLTFGICFHCIILINMCIISSWYNLWFSVFWGVFSVLLLRKNVAWEKMLRFLIKSSFLWSSHQNHFTFGTCFHCIILINMFVSTSWYIL